jgi:ferredoxin
MFIDPFLAVQSILYPISCKGRRGITMVAKVNVDECVGCGACADVCPQEAIAVDDVAVVNEAECVDCGACADECPNNAVTVVKK